MVIVNLEIQTHSRLKKVKKEMKKLNSIYKVNNDVVINHALKKVEGAKEYEISNVD
jgi:hypothetical protein